MNEEELNITTSDEDTNVDPPVDMDLLVEDQPDAEQEYRDGENKEPETQDPDPDKVVEADLSMDPAAATESFIHRMMYMTDEDLERGNEDFNKIHELNDIGVDFYSRSIESIKVVDKHFKETDYHSFEDFSFSKAGDYATEALRARFSPTLRPVSMKDYKMNKSTFDKLLFTKTIKNFKDRFLNPNVASKCSYTINDPSLYGTTSINVRFQSKDGQNAPIGAIYALEWYKGQPAVSPIVPIMKIDQSIEKYYGYFKKHDFDDDGYVKSIDDFFKRPLVKEKIQQLKKDIESKGETFATMKEAQENKHTFGSRYIRGSDPNLNNNITKFIQNSGIVWCYWVGAKGFKTKFLSVVALVKKKNDKIKSVGFAIGINMSNKATINKSKEGFDPDTGFFN